MGIYAFGPSFGFLTLCDGRDYDANGYTQPTAVCGPHDVDNNLHMIAIAPNTVSGVFYVQVQAKDIAMNAVPGRDGNAPNQDWAAWAYNAYQP